MPTPRALARGLQGVLAKVEREIDRAVGPVPPPPSVLHDLHRELRRLSSGLTLWAELLEPRGAAELRPTIRRLRRFARLVGRVRDRDVTLKVLEPLAAAHDPVRETRALRAHLGRLREDGRTGRELLRAFLTTERSGGLLDQVRASLDRTPRPGAAGEIVRIVHDEWRARRRRMRKAHRKARKRPDPERLHRLRIRIRRWRHLATLAEIADVPPPEPVAAGLRTLQACLGHLHDLDVALSSLPDELAGSAAARRLSVILEREERSIRARLDDPPGGRRTPPPRRPRPRGRA